MNKKRNIVVRYTRWLYTLWMIALPLLIFDLLLNWKLSNYISPRYQWLVISAGIVLMASGVAVLAIKIARPMPRGWLPYPGSRGSVDNSDPGGNVISMISWTALIFMPLVLGFLFFGQGLSVHGARSGGFQGNLNFQGTTNMQVTGRNTSKWTFKDWYAGLSSDPEPNDYLGKPVNIDGSAYLVPELPKDQYFILNRYMIWCCAADAVPIGIPVKVTDGMQIPPNNTWVRVIGRMEVETLAGKKRLAVIYADSIVKEKMPGDPYIY